MRATKGSVALGMVFLAAVLWPSRAAPTCMTECVIELLTHDCVAAQAPELHVERTRPIRFVYTCQTMCVAPKQRRGSRDEQPAEVEVGLSRADDGESVAWAVAHASSRVCGSRGHIYEVQPRVPPGRYRLVYSRWPSRTELVIE